MSVQVFDDLDALARAAAERIATAAEGAVRAHGRFDFGLSGGRTPAGLYRALASPAFRERLDWPRVRIYFADERAVPPTDERSNFRLARESLIDAAGISPKHVHRMKGEYPELDVAVEEYEAHLNEPLDALVLGVGEDGHIASIFPGSPLVMERIRRVAAVTDSPKPPARRLTVTPRVIREARRVLALAAGEEKAHAVARALEGAADIREVPARMLREYEWFIDRAASRELRDLHE